MANHSKAQLIERAKALGLKVGDDWTHRQIRDAIIIAETEAEIEREDTDERLGDFTASSDPMIPEPPAPDTASLPVASEPTPIVAPAPPSISVVAPPVVEASKVVKAAEQYDPNRPRIGAGRYHVLWTVTLSGKAVDNGIVDLNDAQARSLVMQGAVVHVDDYEAYLRHNAGTKAVKVETHPAKIPSGAGFYRTIGGVMKNGKEIPHGTVAEFTATEVASLTKPGMIAIEFAD
jgi:hypothetical protein